MGAGKVFACRRYEPAMAAADDAAATLLEAAGVKTEWWVPGGGGAGHEAFLPLLQNLPTMHCLTGSCQLHR